MMTSTIKKAEQQFKLLEEDDKYVVIEKIFSETTRSIDTSGAVPKAIIDISIDGEILDYTGTKNLNDPNVLEEIKKTVKNRISTRSEQMLKLFQEKDVDRSGLENCTKAKREAGTLRSGANRSIRLLNLK